MRTWNRLDEPFSRSINLVCEQDALWTIEESDFDIGKGYYWAGFRDGIKMTPDMRAIDDLQVYIDEKYPFRSLSDIPNKYKEAAEIYHKIFPGSNFYRLSGEGQRKYMEGFKLI
jgi:hypothetical protein